MDLDLFKSSVQGFMAEGLMLVIGSGLSCAEGLPGMGALISEIDIAANKLGGSLDAEWASISAEAKTTGLEAALQKYPPSDSLDLAIKAAISDAISASEHDVIERVLCGGHELPLSSLLCWLGIPEHGLPILTTNYDRLVELACEAAGIAVDTLFDGKVIGRLQPERWRYDQVAELKMDRARQRSVYRKFARVLKPHGSLDWWNGPSGPIRHSGKLSSARMMVTPGTGKYRAGYDEPFDTQRVVANELLSRSERLLLIGYGFNDDHLEAARLSPQIASGKPTLLLARELTSNARALLSTAPRITAVEAIDPSTGDGTRIHFRNEVLDVPSERWWSLSEFVDGILKP